MSSISNLKNRRVLVTGGAGFIGSELVRQLGAGGASVLAVDNLVNGKRENVDLGSGLVELAVQDIRDSDRMSALFEGVDVVFHLACLGVRHSIHAPYENHQVNAEATLRLLLLAREKGIKRFVYVSSSEVYGTALWAPMTEEHPTLPTTVYGSSKLAGECYTRAFYETYRFPTVVIRPFNTYGPRCHHEGDSGEVIPKFLLRALAGKPLIVFGDGTQTRDFTYVTDTARGILTAGFYPDAAGKTLNLGSGKEVAIRDLAREVAEAAGRPDAEIKHDAPRPGDILRLCAEVSKSKDLIGFRPEVSLADGLARLKEWYGSKNCPFEKLLEEEVVHNWKGPSKLDPDCKTVAG